MSKQSSRKAYLTIIPAFNEAKPIAKLVQRSAKFSDVLVVDDGSDDETASLALKAGAKILQNDVNQGYDYSISAGLNWAKKSGYRYAVTVDGDGQISCASAKRAIEQLAAGSDLVIAQRDRLNRWSEKIFKSVARRLWGIADPLTGLKAYHLCKLPSDITIPKFDSVGTYWMLYMIKNHLSKWKRFNSKFNSRSENLDLGRVSAQMPEF